MALKDLINKYSWFVQKHDKFFKRCIVVSKVVFFITFLYTAMVMYKLGDKVTGFMILVIAALYLIFNKIEGI